MAQINDASSNANLLELITGCWISQAISVAAQLRIADLLQFGPMHFMDLAATTQTHPESLYRLLRALASVGIFAEQAPGRFGLTALAEQLRTDSAESLREFAVLVGQREHWRAWEGLLHAVTSGEPGFQHVFGSRLFEYLAGNAEASIKFDAGMTSRSTSENLAIVTSYDFSRATTIVDVGAGQGSLMTCILQNNLKARGVVVDRPHVLRQGTPRIERCMTVEGDFFSAVPPGGDIYILKKVIHDWSDELARIILTNCRSAMSSSACLLVAEPVIPSGNQPSFNKLLDLLMLVWHAGGKERTVEEHERLFASAGFALSRVIHTTCGLDIIEGIPV